MIPFVGLKVMSDCICSVCKHNKNIQLDGFDDYLCCKIVIYTILFLPVLYSTLHLSLMLFFTLGSHVGISSRRLIPMPFLNCTYFFCFVKYLS